MALTLVKAQPGLWSCVIKGHAALDMQALSAVASMHGAARQRMPGHLPLGFEA